MTPFKKIKVLTQAELDAIELAGTQEEGIDYRVKGEINYYMHTVYVQTTEDGIFELQMVLSSDTEITTFSNLIANRYSIIHTCYCSHTDFEDCMAVISGHNTTAIYLWIIGKNNDTDQIETDTATIQSTNIQGITDTVVEL